MGRFGWMARVAAGAAIGLAAIVSLAADYEQALSYFKSGKYAEAAAEFQALVEENPNYDYGYYMLGLSFYKMGKLDEAIKNIAQARALNGDRFEYHHALATAYRAKRRDTDAVKVLNEAEGLLESNPQQKYAFYSLRGFTYADLGKWAEAVQDLERAKGIKASTQILDYLGKAYFKLRHFDKAVPVLRDAAKRNPNDADTHLFLAESLINLAREENDDAKKGKLFEESLQVATRYRRLKPDDYLAANLVGRAALGARDYPTAEEAFRTVLEMEPDYCYAMVNLSKTYIALERWQDAEKLARRATQCAPRVAAGYESLGFALQKQQRLDEALAAYQKAYEIQPTPAIKSYMEVVQQNIQIQAENARIAEEERRLQELAKAEEERIKEEERKRREWIEKHGDD